jgi:DNA-binding MltR family transcriptional regulator
MVDLIDVSFDYDGSVYVSEDKYGFEIDEGIWDELGCEKCCRDIIRIITIDYPDNNLYFEEVMDYQEMVRETLLEGWNEDNVEWE